LISTRDLRSFIFGFVATLFLLFSGKAEAQSAPVSAQEHTGFSAFLAAGTALGVGSIRIGANHWEFGLLNTQTLGVNKSFFSDARVYASLGAGLTISLKEGVAVFGALGWEPRLFWKVYFRSEMNASASTNGMTSGQLLAGLTFRY